MKVKTTKITTANLTTVPSAIRTALEVEAGDSVEWHIVTFPQLQTETLDKPMIVDEQVVTVRKAETKK